MSKKINLESLIQDDKNFNKHSEYGMGLLEKSVESVGVIESITVSSDDKIISGNARHEVMGRKFEGIEPIVIETDGTRPIIVKRTDIASNTKQFHTAAILANTVSKHNIKLDVDKIQEVAIDEYNIDVEELGIDMPEYGEDEEQEEKTYIPTFKFEVTCKTESERNKLMAELMSKGYFCTDDY